MCWDDLKDVVYYWRLVVYNAVVVPKVHSLLHTSKINFTIITKNGVEAKLPNNI